MTRRMNVLLGFDGSLSAETLVNHLHRCALPKHLDLKLLTFVDVYLPAGNGSGNPQDARWLRKEMAAARTRFRQTLKRAQRVANHAAQKIQIAFPSWHVSAKALADSPGWGLIQAAERSHAQLILVGSNRKGFVRRALLGSVSHQVVQHAPCSVRVLRGTPRRGPLRILVGFDGSAGARRALNALTHRSWPPGSSLRCISVLRTPTGITLGTPATLFLPADSKTIERDRQTLEKGASKAIQDWVKKGLKASHEWRTGDARKVLIDSAHSSAADAIVVGARGLTAIDRFLLGSVSNALVHHAPCTVEVVR